MWGNKTEVNSRWELENLQISGSKIYNHLSITGFDKEKNDMGKIAMDKWKKKQYISELMKGCRAPQKRNL